MSTLTDSSASEKLTETMAHVCEDRQPVVITRRHHRSVIKRTPEDYEALNETAHLLRNPANARRLLAATQQLELRKGKARNLSPGE
jgi:antitoxin YefM